MSNEIEMMEVPDDDQMLSFFPLNYDCWWKIFNNCDIETLCHLADTCKGFRVVAEDVFRRHHTKITSKRSFNGGEVSVNFRSIFCRMLCKFT